MLIPMNILESGIERVAANDGNYYSLYGILIERDKDDNRFAYAVASDGKCLVALRWRDDERVDFPELDGCSAVDQPDEPLRVIVGAEKWKTMANMPTKHHPIPLLSSIVLDERQSQHGVIVVGAAVHQPGESIIFTFDEISAAFPDWRRVIDISEPEETNNIWVNPYHISVVAEIVANATAQPNIAIKTYGPSRPFVMAADGGDASGIGVIMANENKTGSHHFLDDIQSISRRSQAS